MRVVQNYLRVGHKFRPGIRITVTTLTIHNTGNPRSTARQERAWLDNPVNLNSGNFASWHYAIDENEVVQAIPDNEMSYHAKSGNRSSIGIEVCESGNQTVVWQNAVRFTAQLLRKHNLTANDLRTHRDWTGKNCPRLILPRWNEFVAAVRVELNTLLLPKVVAPTATPTPTPTDTNSATILISYNGAERTFSGTMQGGRAFVPVRPLLEALGFTVGWDAEKNAITITRITSLPNTWV